MQKKVPHILFCDCHFAVVPADWYEVASENMARVSCFTNFIEQLNHAHKSRSISPIVFWHPQVKSGIKLHLSFELLGLLGRVILGVSCNVATADVLDRDVLDVETNVVARLSQLQRRVVHLHRFHLRGHIHRRKRHDHAGFQRARLHSAHRHRANTCTQPTIIFILVLFTWHITIYQTGPMMQLPSGCWDSSCCT